MVVVAILRPGYADPAGLRSPGARGLATGDNYTPEAIAALRAAVLAAKAQYKARDVTIVGHSGGAALAADLAESDPGLMDRLLLVSCPCDLRTWRRHMAVAQLNPLWLLPVRSQSPLDGVSRLPKSLRLRMIVGQQDTTAPPALTLTFVNAARVAGVHASSKVLGGAGHRILLDPRVLQELASLEATR
jgi:pimeloyl-ACP methyl ester carboxylesterase